MHEPRRHYIAGPIARPIGAGTRPRPRLFALCPCPAAVGDRRTLCRQCAFHLDTAVLAAYSVRRDSRETGVNALSTRRTHMADEVNRRDFLGQLGLTVGVAAASATAGVPLLSKAERAEAQEVKGGGKIPDPPYKVGHMTFHTGPAAVLGEPMYKGHILAAEEINAHGGLLGKRKIETLKADEAAGTDANVKEMRRMKLSEKVDFFSGITSSGNTPALGPVAEELKLLTVFVDGCTDFLFDKAVPNPHYIFRITNIQSADGVTCALAIAQTWPKAVKVAHIHPD